MFCKQVVIALLAFICSMFAVAADTEKPSPIAALAWQFGPGEGVIGDKASIKIPEGFGFLGTAETKKFMELNQNFSNPNEYLLAPKSMDWFAIFQFEATGYVKDDETIDAAKLLETIKQGTAKGNEERRRRGWSTLSIQSWRFQPQYDQQTKLLEWAVLAKDDQSNTDVINYNTRLLGRTGVMQVVLVADPAMLDTAVATLKTTLSGYSFAPGEKYAEFKQGDRVAEFGLAALVAGGAAAVAAKKGFFAAALAFLAGAWKLVVAGFIAAFAGIKALFKKKDQ